MKLLKLQSFTFSIRMLNLRYVHTTVELWLVRTRLKKYFSRNRIFYFYTNCMEEYSVSVCTNFCFPKGYVLSEFYCISKSQYFDQYDFALYLCSQ